MRSLILYIFFLTPYYTFAQALKKEYIANVYAEHSVAPLQQNNPHGNLSENLHSLDIVYIRRIHTYFPQQLTNPQQKNRKSLAQFGYIFPMSEFIVPGRFGQHSYGKPARKEHNGCLYTRRGGFIDFSHLRVAVDWTVYLTFKILAEKGGFSLPPEAGILELHFTDVDKLSLEDISSLAQKIAFERLLWHEVASWHYHLPNFSVSEQQSAFTPEDLYSNLVGTVIGKNVALRLLNNPAKLSYSQVATDEIERYIVSLDPVPDKKETKQAYKSVDLRRQKKLPEAGRNNDVWWNSRKIFVDLRYVMKRYLNIGPHLEPWLVPSLNSELPKAEILTVPQQTSAGKSFYNYYEFRISPDKKLVNAKGPQKHRHTPFEAFTTRDFACVIEHVRNEMELILLPGFDERNYEKHHYSTLESFSPIK